MSLIHEPLYCQRTNRVYKIRFFGVSVVTGDVVNNKGKHEHFILDYKNYRKLKHENQEEDFSVKINQILSI